MNVWGVLLAAVAAALGLLWLLIPRSEDETRDRITWRAGLELVEACNQAALAAGMSEHFSAENVVPSRLEPAEELGGVVALASVLEARRGHLLCKWNGVDLATVARLD